MAGSLNGRYAQPAAAYKGNPNEAVWLRMNKWPGSGWNTSGTEPLLTLLRRSTVQRSGDVEGSAGNEIYMDAEADFESGIGGFFVMRDNRALVRLPAMTAAWGLWTPVVPGVSYHDTPREHPRRCGTSTSPPRRRETHLQHSDF